MTMPYFAGAAGWFTEAFYAHQVGPKVRFSPHMFLQFNPAKPAFVHLRYLLLLESAARICCSNLPATVCWSE